MAGGRKKLAVWEHFLVLPITAANERFMECRHRQMKIKCPSGNKTNMWNRVTSRHLWKVKVLVLINCTWGLEIKP